MKTTCRILQILQSVKFWKNDSTETTFKGSGVFFPGPTDHAASPIPTWLLLVLMAIGAKRQRVDRRGSEAAGDGDECKGRDGEGCPFSTADYKQRRQSNGDGNGLKRYCKRCSKKSSRGLSRCVSMPTRPLAPRSSHSNRVT